MTICYCGNHLSFEECCKPFIKGLAKVNNTEQLMRSRYSAYATQEVGYIIKTTHKSRRSLLDKKDILAWTIKNHYTNLEILDVTENTVTFKASYIDNHKKEQVLFEKSTFVFEDGKWYYIDGEFL
jgi:SEC-C motif domain protein